MNKLFLFSFLVLVLMAFSVSANTIPSSTMYFYGTLTDEGGGIYSGVVNMIDEGGEDSGYDVYAKEGDYAWFGNDPGTGPVWTSQLIADHDAWPAPQWDPDTPDWYQYSLNLYESGGQQRWAVRNHAGSTEVAPHSTTPKGVPMSGIMDWGNMYAFETDTGAYLPATGTPEIPGGAVLYGGGAQAWDMDWSWGSEVVPLQFPGFDVEITPMVNGEPGSYTVVLTPAAPPSGSTGTTIGIGIGVDLGNTCPLIVQEEPYEITYEIDTYMDEESTIFDQAFEAGWAGRSYAFEGETVTFEFYVADRQGIYGDCVDAVVTLENEEDHIQAGCTLQNIVAGEHEYQGITYPHGTIGKFTCTYTVEPVQSGTYGDYWISVQATDTCGSNCSDTAAGIISLFLNPAVGLTISSQDTFGFMYDAGGDALTEGPYAGDTVYSPFFTVENTADSDSGLYILMSIYGTHMWDYDSSAAICPTSNILTIDHVDYKAAHLDVQQPWTALTTSSQPIFTSDLAGNFLGVGDDITMRTRLNIPYPCEGTFDDGGQIIFTGQVI